MRAIVVVIVRNLEAKVLKRELTELTISGIERYGGSDMREKRQIEEPLTPPFWTWFIENPRDCNYL